jgi:HD-like signal output (HDOD) protein
MVGRLRTLPSLPQVYVDITNAMERPNTTMGHIAEIIERDPALVAKTFQIVNSAYFGTAREITCVQEAVRYLGIDAMKSLVLTEHLLVTMRCPKFDGFSLGEFQRHSWMTARVAKTLLRDGSRANQAYSAGVLHDIGTVILACAAPDQFAEVLAKARETKRQMHEVERELLGTTHAEAGAYLLGLWGLPFWMVEAVAFHHSPGEVMTSGRDVLLAVHVGDRLVSDFVEAPDALEETFASFTDEERALMLDQSKWKGLVNEEAQGAGVA